jgi:hypothetical protein
MRLPSALHTVLAKEVILEMKVLLAIVGIVLFLPVALFVAVALGPVALGILCAVGFGLIVFAVANVFVGAAALGRAGFKRAGARHRLS